MNSRRFRSLVTLSLIVIDAAMLCLAFLLAYYLRLVIRWPTEAAEMGQLSSYLSVLTIFIVCLQFTFYWFRLYHLGRAISRVDEFYAIVGGVTVGTLLGVAIVSLSLKNSLFEVNLPRMMILYLWAASILLMAAGRFVLQALRVQLQIRGAGQDRVIIVGVGETARMVRDRIQASPYLGYSVLGLVDPNGSAEDASTEVLGHADDLPRLIEEKMVDEVILAVPEASDDDLLRLIGLCHRNGVSLKVFPSLYDIITAGVSIDDLGGLPLLSVRDVSLRGWRLASKRAMDIVVSAVGLILISPVLLLVAIIIKLDSRGPAIFVQERMGLDSKPFTMFKFRSMRSDAEAHGPGWTVEGDPRVTRLGRFIRRYSIDELPQLINVLLGDMSLVGPRPEQPAYVERFQRLVPRYMERHREKAGLTGWAQINGLRGDTSISERTKYDLWYVENWSILLDIKILIRTVLRTVWSDRTAF